LDFFRIHGRLPDFTHPKTFSEKILHRKVNDRDVRLPAFADKVLVKSHVAEGLGLAWIIPTIWSGFALPERWRRSWALPYVLKANHGSGWNYFVTSREDENWERIEQMASSWLRSKFGAPAREWLYSQISPQLLVEPFIGEGGLPPIDYKIWVFAKRARFVQVDTGRGLVHRRCFYDRCWTKQQFGLKYPLEERDLPAPKSLDRLLWAAERLAQDLAFVRVDFYEVEGRPFFGEMTFYPGSGLEAFEPCAYDGILGSYWPDR